MIPWSLGIRAQYEKLLCPRVVMRGSSTLWFLGAWVSGLNMKNYCAPESSWEESGHYDSLETGYQLSIGKLVFLRVVQREIRTLWFLRAWLSGLNRTKRSRPKTCDVKWGIITLWFLRAWISGLNMWFSTEWSKEESLHYNTLDSGYQGSVGLRGPDTTLW